VLLQGATLLDGRVADVRIDGAHIGDVALDRLVPRPNEEIHDLAGRVLLPSPIEPHAHLDKAYTARSVVNPTGDLAGAIAAWYQYRRTLTTADIAIRAREAALAGVVRGVTAIRTHVDVGEGIELRALEALVEVRAELEWIVTIEIVAMTSRPVTGVAGADNRALLRAALVAGADLVGGAPHVDPDPLSCLEFFVETAAEFACGMDLHTDETLAPGRLGLADLARLVAGGFPHPVTASHCVRLGAQPLAVQARVAAAVAAAGISVVTLPQTNLYLQARGVDTSAPRGLTALAALRQAGVNVAAGGDNIRDPFNPLGRADPLETAGLLVAAGHLDPIDAYHAVSTAARIAMARPPVAVAPGDPADLLAIWAPSADAAIATASEDRRVYRRGCLVATTTVSTQLAWPPPARTP
jgi:cytosine deaminase